jgi:hypothetical protein
MILMELILEKKFKNFILKILKAFLNLSKTNFSYGKEILAIDN